MIVVRNLVKANKLAKISNGVNIFNAMKSEYNKDNSIVKFTLDMDGIVAVSPIVFREIIRQMQTRLDGNFQLELVNANLLIKSTFKQVVG